MSQKKVYISIVIIIFLVVAGGVLVWQYQPKSIEQGLPIVKSNKLEKPALSNLGESIQIVINHECGKKYNIYRSLSNDSGFEKIFDVNFVIDPNTGNCNVGSLVDYNYPKKAQDLYYKYILLDDFGNEIQESEIGSIAITN